MNRRVQGVDLKGKTGIQVSYGQHLLNFFKEVKLGKIGRNAKVNMDTGDALGIEKTNVKALIISGITSAFSLS